MKLFKINRQANSHYKCSGQKLDKKGEINRIID